MNEKKAKRLRKLAKAYAELTKRETEVVQEIHVATKKFLMPDPTNPVAIVEGEVKCYQIVHTDGERFIYKRMKRLADSMRRFGPRESEGLLDLLMSLEQNKEAADGTPKV